MDIRKLQRAIVDGLEDVKGQDIRVFNTEHLSALFERVIVASGLSNRQTKALAAGVRDKVREKGFRVFSTEGEDNGEWIIVDCGAAVVHIMQPEIRQYYHLEEIWGEKPVRVKLLGQSTGLVKASEPMDEPEPPEVPVRPVARPVKPKARGTAGATAKSAAASQPATRSTRKPAGKAVPTRVSASGGAARPAGKGGAAKTTGASRKTTGAARKTEGAARKSSGVAPKATAPAAKAKAVAAGGSGRTASRSGTTARPARPAASSRGGAARPGAAKTPRRSS